MAINEEKGMSLENVISAALQLPGIKVNREAFLRKQFKDAPKNLLDVILAKGPIAAKCDRTILDRKAKKIINERTIFSTGASFAVGLPGGLAMTATIPADMLQFYGVALRMAQEIAYLYGEADLWNGDFLSNDKVTNQLILYCGVMFGASGASQAVRVMSSSLAKQMLKKLPQQALTKTFYYPIVKQIAKYFGVSMTKGLFAKGVSKAIPIIGGVVSGGITFATLRPMGHKLAETLDEAHFAYTEFDFKEDWEDIVEVNEADEDATSRIVEEATAEEEPAKTATTSSVVEEITKAKQLLDAGIITDQEFADLKAKLIAKL